MLTRSARRSVPVLINLIVMAACLFGSAGRLEWLNGWTLISLSALTGVAAEIVLSRNPALSAERRNIKAGEKWDQAIVLFVVLIGPVATWITAGLDYRHGWSVAPSAMANGLGVILAIAGGSLLVWAMQSNPYFSSVARIQKDRGHTVVRQGPYRFVRHPGYSGMSLFMVAAPLILGSWWASLPALVTVMVTVIRTALEERFLSENLPGYTNYVQAVKYKLLPWMW